MRSGQLIDYTSTKNSGYTTELWFINGEFHYAELNLKEMAIEEIKSQPFFK